MINKRTISLSQCFGLVKRCSHNNSTIKSNNYVDIVISGGGMVGNAMACALGKLITMLYTPNYKFFYFEVLFTFF